MAALAHGGPRGDCTTTACALKRDIVGGGAEDPPLRKGQKRIRSASDIVRGAPKCVPLNGFPKL